MKVIKSFDLLKEIAPYIEEQGLTTTQFIGEYLFDGNVRNDCAISWSIEPDEEYEYECDVNSTFYKEMQACLALNKYLKDHGCEEKEEVYLWLSW